MNKDHKNTLAEFAGTLSEGDLRYLLIRLNDRLEGDLPTVLEIISKTPKVDAVFAAAISGVEIFSMCDQLRDSLSKEGKRRGFLGNRHYAA